jgi:Na+-translocating ferredoxin:NAD+ oxidoreductase RnfD subunit
MQREHGEEHVPGMDPKTEYGDVIQGVMRVMCIYIICLSPDIHSSAYIYAVMLSLILELLINKLIKSKRPLSEP